MAEQSFFDKVSTHSTHVPDVLSCIANLSNDEVFTPPEVVNRMLDMLPQELFANPDTTFLDPATKTGVFLREIAKRCLEAQLPGYQQRTEEIAAKKAINVELDEYDIAFQKQLQEKIDHIFHKQLFGIGITELTSLLARRSVYCSKYPNGPFSISHFDDAEGNIRFRRTEHVWKDGKCTFCGVSKKTALGNEERGKTLESHAYEWIHNNRPEDIFKMNFDVIISNPPYQLDDGGAQASAMPIYNLFVEKAKQLNPKFLCMIIPSRWFTGGKNLDDFRNSMLHDNHIKEIHDFWNASDCFPGVEIKGGVCYFLRDKYHNGQCKVATHQGNEIVSEMIRPLQEKNCDVFIRQNDAISILHKVMAFNEPSFSEHVHSAMTFGLRTFFDDFDSEKATSGMIKVFAKQKQAYMKREKIERGREYIDSWKVYVPEAIGSGDTRTDVIKPIIGEPETISTETYIMNGPWSSENEAKNVCSYIGTKFFHFMIGLKKITQHTTAKVYEFVPMQDFTKQWTDDELYRKYKLSKSEIECIENAVWPDKGVVNNG